MKVVIVGHGEVVVVTGSENALASDKVLLLNYRTRWMLERQRKRISFFFLVAKQIKTKLSKKEKKGEGGVLEIIFNRNH